MANKNRVTTDIGSGQRLRVETAPDRSTDPRRKEDLLGRDFGGGPTDVSHSLTSAGQVQTYMDKGSKRGR